MIIPWVRERPGIVERNTGIDAYVQEVRKEPIPPPERQIALWRGAMAGSSSDSEALIRANLRMVIDVAYGFLPGPVPLSDLVGAGNYALVDAFPRYDPGNGANPSTFFRRTVACAMLDEVRRRGPLGSRHEERLQILYPLETNIRGEHCEFPLATSETPETTTMRDALIGQVWGSISRLAEAERYVLTRVVRDGERMRTIAEDMNITPDSAKRLYLSALSNLRKDDTLRTS